MKSFYKNAEIIIGLGFGDEGKGNFTSYRCSKSKNPIVVRFSGGQQCGHTVMFENFKHVFSNYGSGSFLNIPTYYTEHTTIYLNSIFNEKQILNDKGINPKLIVNPLTKITTPYDIAFGQAREKKLRHGSCGLGVGSTMSRNIESGYKLYAIDFLNKSILTEKLNKINEYYLDLSYKNNFNIEYRDILYNNNFEDLFFKLISENLFEIKDYNYLNNYDNLIFEGSQGIMLDMDHGIFPNVTYSNTTCKNAIHICNLLNYKPEIFYITRCYQTRHGNGWVSNYKKINIINNKDEININNEWQGEFKIFEIDYDLLNYTLSIDKLYRKETDINLVVTCLDQRTNFNFKYDNLNFDFKRIYNSNSPFFDKIKEIKIY